MNLQLPRITSDAILECVIDFVLKCKVASVNVPYVA